MKNGVADCLVKPIDQDDLRASAHAARQRQQSSIVSNRNGDDSTRSARKSHIDIPPGTSLEDLERAAVEQALVQHHGNRTHAAKTLGISVRTLQRKLKAWGMPIVVVSQHQTKQRILDATSAVSTPHIFSTHVQNTCCKTAPR